MSEIDTNIDLKELRVLVVDDHMMMRNIVTQTLRSFNIVNIESASNGKIAYEDIVAKKNAGTPYHIIFMDWHMPEMEGIEVLKLCRADKEYQNTAIIMLTAEQEEKNILKAIEEGATSYIIKPASTGKVENTLSKILAWLEKHNPQLINKQNNRATEEKIIELGTDKQETSVHTLPNKLQNELSSVVQTGIENIFSDLFSVKTVPESDLKTLGQKDMICLGKLYQEGMTMILRFFFDHALLKPLLGNLYTEEHLEDETVYSDAACEIVNILCNQVKVFLNKNGYKLELDFPEMGRQESKCTDADSIMNVHFSLNEKDHFFVDVTTSSESANKHH